MTCQSSARCRKARVSLGFASAWLRYADLIWKHVPRDEWCALFYAQDLQDKPCVLGLSAPVLGLSALGLAACGGMFLSDFCPTIDNVINHLLAWWFVC